MRRELIELDNHIEGFYFNAQEALTNLHMNPDDFFNQDYFEFNEVLSARKPEDRPVSDPLAFLNNVRKGV